MAREDLKYIIGFEVNDTPVVLAAKKMASLNREQASLQKLYKSGMMSQALFKKGTAQLTAEMGRLRTAVGGGEAALQQYINQVQKGGKANKQFQTGIQQAGYQIGDFAVQVQGGTNPLVAFSQQFSQLAGFFGGPWGAAVGAGVAILSGIGVYFMKASAEVEKGSESLKKYREELLKLKGIDALDPEQLELQKKIGDIDAKILKQKGFIAAREKELADYRLQKNQSAIVERTLVDEIATRTSMLLDLEVDRKEEADKSLAITSALVDLKKEEATIASAAILRDIARMEVEQQMGTVSLEARQALRDIAIEEYEIDLKRSGTLAAAIPLLVEQKMEALALKDALEMAAMAGQKITFNLGGKAATAMNKYASRTTTSNKALDDGLPKTPKEPKGTKDALESAKAELALQREIYSTEGARRAGIELLGTAYLDYSTDQVRLLGEEKNAVDTIIAAEKQRVALGDYAAKSIEDSLMSMVDGTMSVQDAFKNMAAEIIKELYRVLVVQKMVNAAKSYFGFADGGAFSGGSPIAFANGGVVGSPTTFPMSGGKTGLMGEAGPEAIMPLKRGPDGKLGVESNGGGAVTIQQNFNFSANGDESVKKLIAQAAPKIAQMTQQKIVDSRRRGGQMKAVFG